MRRRATLVLVVVTGMFVGSAFIVRPYLHGAAFVVRAADMHGFAREVADLDTHALTEQIMTIDTPHGPLRGRMYLPARSVHRTVLLTSGLHPSGIDEPRLLRLARNLASAGLAVFTPDIPDLSEFSITPA